MTHDVNDYIRAFQPDKEIKFELGRVVWTPGASALLARKNVPVMSLLAQHATGDWGDVGKEDAGANDDALKHGDRLLSSYKLDGVDSVWIITEHDRSVTTVLLPSEY